MTRNNNLPQPVGLLKSSLLDVPYKLVRRLLVSSCLLFSPVTLATPPDQTAYIDAEISKLVALYSDGFAYNEPRLRHVVYGPLFESERPAAVAFFSLAGVGLSNIHHEYIAIFAQGNGLDLKKVKGPKERAFHLVATSLVGSRRTRTLNWQTAQISPGKIIVNGQRWVKGDPGCCPSHPIEVTFKISPVLTSELTPEAYPIIGEVER